MKTKVDKKEAIRQIKRYMQHNGRFYGSLLDARVMNWPEEKLSKILKLIKELEKMDARKYNKFDDLIKLVDVE